MGTPGAEAIRKARIGAIPSIPEPIPWHDLDEADSTMEYAASLASRGVSGWTVVTAHSQRSGRGTRGRDWYSPHRRGLWVSVIMPPPRRASDLDGLTVMAAEVLAASLEDVTGVPFSVKPPNDVVRRGKKVAGILVETVVRNEAVGSVILGMGVNIRQEEADFKAAGLPDATSLWLEAGVSCDRIRVLETFLDRFRPLYETFALRPEKSMRSVGRKPPTPDAAR